MAETVHDRLDREAARLKTEQNDGMTRVSDSFISGIEHAANIAYRMEPKPRPVSGDDATAAEADTSRAITDLTAAFVRLVIDSEGSGDPEDAYEVALFHAAEKAGIDLHAALVAHFERGAGK